MRIDGPGDKKWSYAVELDAHGSFHHKFEEDELPSGDYVARVLHKKEETVYATATF